MVDLAAVVGAEEERVGGGERRRRLAGLEVGGTGGAGALGSFRIPEIAFRGLVAGR